MKTTLLTCSSIVLMAFATHAFAAPIPSFARQALRPLPVKIMSFDGATLRVIANRDRINQDTYQSIAITGICWSAHNNEKQAKRIKRIEVLNNVDKSGLALEGGGNTCLQMSNMNSEATRQYIDQHTIQCTEGVCKR
jgi:hypothetical protein